MPLEKFRVWCLIDMQNIYQTLRKQQTGSVLKRQLYCSGYWALPGNKKHSNDHYYTHLPNTLDMIRGQDLVFFSDDVKYMTNVRNLCAVRGITLQERYIPVAELPAFDVAKELVECCARMALDRFAKPPSYNSEKGIIHYWRDFQGSGEAIYHALLAIWLSKVHLASSTAQSDSERPVAWIDISISRFNGRRENDKFFRLDLPSDRLSHYGSNMQFFGTPLPLNASFLSATPAVWLEIKREFSYSIERAKYMSYAHDEETVFADCVWRRPELFYLIGLPSYTTRNLRAKRFVKAAYERIFR